jgi:hypothetical protein
VARRDGHQFADFRHARGGRALPFGKHLIEAAARDAQDADTRWLMVANSRSVVIVSPPGSD